MFAAFLMFFAVLCATLGLLSLIGSAMDRTTHSRRNRYCDHVAEHHRRISRNGFKSRAGIR